MRHVRLVIGLTLILIFNLPTLLTNKLTNETMTELLKEYDNIPNSYINFGILEMLDYIRLYNIAADANVAIWQFDVAGSTGASEYLSVVVSKADVWEKLELSNDKLLSTVRRGMLLVGKDNNKARELFGTIMSHGYFKFLIILKAFCYEIRFKAVGFYYTLILISVVIAGLLIYDKWSSMQADIDYLDEDENIYSDEE